MPKSVEPSLTWEQAPDIITPTQLGRILGVSYKTANQIFNSKNFPMLSEDIAKRDAYKYAVAKHLGIDLTFMNSVNNFNTEMLEVLKEILASINKSKI